MLEDGLMTDSTEPEAVRVSLRSSDAGIAVCRPWCEVGADALGAAAPWRTFRWYRGQNHYSGTYWSATNQRHVIYESRLELGRLLQADFDLAVRGIVAQPFLLTAVVRGAMRKHIPDYLLLTETGPVVVDVKPPDRAAKPANAFTFAWTAQVVRSRGWAYEVWTGAYPMELENIRFLAGYRRAWLFDQRLMSELCDADLDGATLGQACQRISGWPKQSVRAALLHLLWTQHFTTDLSRPLGARHVLKRRP
jgi:hypothetical protein